MHMYMYKYMYVHMYSEAGFTYWLASRPLDYDNILKTDWLNATQLTTILMLHLI